MPEADEYLLTNVGFSLQEAPYISLQQADTFSDLLPLQKTLTLRFDSTQRFCVGWRDITKGERFACPDHTEIDSKYEQCSDCQQRTGFNPAFYYASSISTQQEARNLEPHTLYLAHFGPGIIKVGISYTARERSRLLEQGARSALILDAFPTAHIARQYEARIAALPHIVETIQLRKKIATLAKEYDAKVARRELHEMRTSIQTALNVTFTKNDPMVLDPVYFPGVQPVFGDAYDTTDQHLISGSVIGMLGSLLFCTQHEGILFLPLKKYVGYKLTLTYEETLVTLPARQTSLF